jgi:hypothetical protein
MLDRYARLKSELAEIQNELEEIEAQLRLQVETSGEVAGFGFRAYMKPGRKSTNHEAAAHENGAWDSLIEKHSKTKVTVSWAKVTAEMGLKNLSEYTTEGQPAFVVESI